MAFGKKGGSAKGTAKGKGSSKGKHEKEATVPVQKTVTKKGSPKGAQQSKGSGKGKRKGEDSGDDQIALIAKVVEALTADKSLIGKLGKVLQKDGNHKESTGTAKGKSKGKGKGKGKSKGKGKGKREEKELTGVVSEDFEVNETIKYTGVVTSYAKFKGFGFIAMDKKNVVPDDSVFVYWPEIKSDDRFPSLLNDTKVQFNLKKEEKRGKFIINAMNVSLPGGGAINNQDDIDEKKTFVGGDKFLRYTGKLKFFDHKNQFGYIQIDEGYDYQGDDVPAEIRVELSEILFVDGRSGKLQDMEVEFGIWKTLKRAQYKAYNMTMPGGDPIKAPERPVRED